GAEFVDNLRIDRVDEIVQKGTNPEIDSYSGFYDNEHRQATGLGDFLEDEGVDTICLCGVATDVCVKFTALDGCQLDFDTWVVVDGCRGVGQQLGDIDTAFGEMREAGAKLIDSDRLAAARE
ncbi:MAG: isochorismatase family protein, partial [Bradymonadaceae bacterium]